MNCIKCGHDDGVDGEGVCKYRRTKIHGECDCKCIFPESSPSTSPSEAAVEPGDFCEHASDCKMCANPENCTCAHHAPKDAVWEAALEITDRKSKPFQG